MPLPQALRDKLVFGGILSLLLTMAYYLYMQFELTEALIDEILFFMEDQNGEFYLDTVEGIVVSEIDVDDEKRFIDLPEWDSADGFRLMEQFAAGFRNPLIRNELKAVLGQGRGVFRAFKNTMTLYPEAEKLWFSFKENEMKREIITWYNGLREEWGLEKIGMEPEETGDLVLEDFRFRTFAKGDFDKAKELHQFCLEEYRQNLAEKGVKNSTGALVRESLVFHNSRPNLFADETASPAIHAMTAETGGGEFAGYIAGILDDSVLYIQNLEVKAEYRGLGIGEALLLGFLEHFDADDLSQVLLDLPSWAEGFSRLLLRESFQPYAVRYQLNPRDRLS